MVTWKHDNPNLKCQPVDGLFVITSHLKKRIMGQNRGGFKFQADSVAVLAKACILRYVEDLELGSNKEFGPKDFFEMTCIKYLQKGNNISTCVAVVTGCIAPGWNTTN